MSSAWVTLIAALGGTVVGGGITLIAQALDASRRAKTDAKARLAANLCDVAEGSTAGSDSGRQAEPPHSALVPAQISAHRPARRGESGGRLAGSCR